MTYHYTMSFEDKKYFYESLNASQRELLHFNLVSDVDREAINQFRAMRKEPVLDLVFYDEPRKYRRENGTVVINDYLYEKTFPKICSD